MIVWPEFRLIDIDFILFKVQAAMKVVPKDAGEKGHIIVKNFPKLNAHLNAIRADVLDLIHVNVVIFSALVAVLAQNKATVW